MSGEALRYAAAQGQHELIRNTLKDRANPCSADEYGLTALMYGVWNGHVECVKYLACNYMGVDGKGVKCSSLNLKSSKGYNALHLVAIDSPRLTRKEIALILLIAGVDRTQQCNEELTAYDLARKFNNEEVLEALSEFDRMSEDQAIYDNIQDIRKRLTDYFFDRTLRLQVEPWESDFKIPEFIFEKQRAGAIPNELKIHEHQILPLITEGDQNMKSKESLRCLLFTSEQAMKNQGRRAELLQIVDQEWKPLDVNREKIYLKKKKH